MKRKVIQFFVLLFAMAVLLAVLHYMHFGGFTGWAVFTDSSGGDFNGGTYSNTEWNGSSVVLSPGQTSGTFTSRVFDAGNDATWNSLSYAGGTPTVELLFCVDGGGDIYKSTDFGVNWILSQEDFGRTTYTTNMFSNTNYLYILSSAGNEVWRSANGTGFVVVYNDFEGKSPYEGERDSNGNLYAVTGVGDVWRSADNGITWTNQGDFNGASTNDPKGIAIDSNNYIYVVGGAGNVFKSTDSGVTWVKMVDGYGGGSETDDLGADSNDYLYILLNKKIYKSTDSGVTWNIINDSFTSYSNNGMRMLIDDNDNFYIADAIGRIFKSTDFGVSWTETGDCNNAAGNDPKGLTDFSQSTNLTFQVRNCSLADCSDGNWQTKSLSSLNLVGRYFQYKVGFTTPDSPASPTLTSTSIDYLLINSAPVLNLVAPSDGETYGYNESIALEYSVTDADGNLDKCWYNIDGGNNLSLENCENTTFNISEGSYEVYVYANDTQGAFASDSASFSVSVGAPSIALNSPINSYLSSGENIIFRYTPTDVDLQACELWGDFDGSFRKNQTDNSPTSGIENNFLLNLADRSYLWNVGCNDSQGHEAVNGNKTFYVDTIAPSLTLTEPNGAKISRTGIPLTFSVSEINKDKCWYNVYRGENLEIGNTTINCSFGSGSFGVTVDASFILNFYANDSAGNLGNTSLSFSVDSSTSPSTPQPPSGGGGGGGGGGGAIIPATNGTRIINLEFSNLKEMILKRGENEKITLGVTSKDGSFLNNCGLVFEGEAGNWLGSSQSKGLSKGEKFNYEIFVNVPQDAEPGSYSANILVKCDEGSAGTRLMLTTYRNTFEAEILDYERVGSDLKVTYTLKEFAKLNHEIVINYSLVDFDGVVRMRGLTLVVLGSEDFVKYVLKFNLPKDSFGEFELKMELSDGVSLTSVNKKVFLPSGTSAGLAIFEGGRENLSLIGVVVVLVLVFIFAGRFIWRHHRRTRKSVKGRRFIDLEL